MQKRLKVWRFLAALGTLAIFGPSVIANEAPDKQEASNTLPQEIAEAWQDAGAELGWMKDLPPQSLAHGFWEPWRKKAERGAVPAFRFPGRNADGVLAKLPDPGTPFGLDFHCGFYAGVTQKELAKLKNLHTLCIGGVQGNVYAELKELAGLKSLRGLYLFYSGVTDAELKHLAGLKNLQTLDLSNTPVTDVGLKELVGLKSMKALNIAETSVTDTGLKDVAELKGLQWLNLRGTKVTVAGAATLERELPKCKIVLGDD
jgi:hypothetical protein